MHARLVGTGGDASRARDQLFASLDTATSSARLTDGSDVLLVDTVGFVRDLSHGLVDCFHATLQEALECDALVFVIDSSDPRAAAAACDGPLDLARPRHAGGAPRFAH